MKIVAYAVLGLALFFAVSWTLGMLSRPDMRLKCNVVTVMFWWVEIAFSGFGLYSVFNLLWLMPLSIFVPGVIQTAELRQRLQHASTGLILVKSAIPIGIAIAVLVYLSGA